MSAKDTATALWSVRVRQLAGNRCERCGSDDGLQAHHIFPRNRLATRTDESNGVALCVRCHVPFAHAFPKDFETWCRALIGGERYDALEAKSRQLYARPQWDEEVIRLRRVLAEAS